MESSDRSWSKAESPKGSVSFQPDEPLDRTVRMNHDLRMEFTFKPIGFLRTPYRTTETIPKSFGIAPTAEGTVEVLDEYTEGLLEIESFSHLILIFAFHQSHEKPLTVVPPTQIKARGVFASRSPERPNGVGILTVQLIKRDGNRLSVKGVDLVDDTPILDIKPYLLHFDCWPEATARI